jgi:hypothetical protein
MRKTLLLALLSITLLTGCTVEPYHRMFHHPFHSHEHWERHHHEHER